MRFLVARRHRPSWTTLVPAIALTLACVSPGFGADRRTAAIAPPGRVAIPDGAAGAPGAAGNAAVLELLRAASTERTGRARLTDETMSRTAVEAPAEDTASLAGVPVLRHLPASLDLFVGQSSVLEVPDLARVVVGSGKLLDARTVDGRYLLLIAQDAGDTTLHLWRRTGQVQEVRVRVNVSDAQRVEGELRELTAGMEGVTLRRVGEKVVVDGNDADPQVAPRLAALARLYPQVTLLPGSNRVGLEPMVDIEVKIVALTRRALDDLGVRWQSSTDGLNFGIVSDVGHRGDFRVLPQNSPFLPSGNGTVTGDALGRLGASPRAYLGLASVLGSRLQLLVQRGDAEIVATPNLTTRSGGEARFLAGGEFPLPAVGAFGGTVEFKPYGVVLNVRPRADRAGNVAGSVLAEVSSIDQAVAVQGIPGLQIRRTETDFNLRSGETIVLSGLVSRENAVSADGLPGLRNIPLLGHLFKSRNVANNEFEVLVFMTPRVVTPADSVARIERTRSETTRRGERMPDLSEEGSP